LQQALLSHRQGTQQTRLLLLLLFDLCLFLLDLLEIAVFIRNHITIGIIGIGILQDILIFITALSVVSL